MVSKLFTSWGDYQVAIDRVLSMAQAELCIYDADLSQLKLESSDRHELLRHLLQEQRGRLRISLRNASLFRDRSPRLMELLRRHSDRMEVIETPDSLAHLRDSFLLADDQHGVIRFDQDQARCKLVLQDEDALVTYRQRFHDIWHEGGTPISATTLGL